MRLRHWHRGLSVTQPACTCGSPSPDATICRDCTRDLGATLTLAALIAPDLVAAAARQLHRQPGPASPGGDPPLPYDPRAAGIRDRLLHITTAWAHDLTARHTTT